MVPQGQLPRAAIETILVGWIDSREAARAVAEALPLLGLASKVELAYVGGPQSGRFGGAERLADIATHLDRRGVRTSVSVLPVNDTAATALLDEAHRISADLIVSGAYGHSRFREWVLGGTTRDLIGASDLPLLMAH